MTMIMPDCRNDEVYNVKNLKKADKEFIDGYDWATEMEVDNFFDNNMGELEDEETYLGRILCEELPKSLQEEYEMEFTFGDRESETRQTKTYADLIRFKILEWLEMGRNELITSMIDSYGDDECDG